MTTFRRLRPANNSPLSAFSAWLALLVTVQIAGQAQTVAAWDHLQWGAVPGVVQAGEPFNVRIQARSVEGAIATNYTGPAMLSQFVPGQAPSLVISEVQTLNSNRVELSNVSTTPVDVSGWRIALYDYASWPAPKIEFTFPPQTVCPPLGVFEVHGSGAYPGAYPVFSVGVSLQWSIATASKPLAALLLTSDGDLIDVFCAGGGYPHYISVPTAVPPAEWSGPAVVVNLNPQLTYQRGGHSDHHNAADWAVATNNLGVLNPGLRFPFFAPANPAPVTPSFLTLTNGEWSGGVIVSMAGTNAFLRAEGDNGIMGDSGAFTVLGLPALTVRVPHEAYKETPGAVGQGTVSIPQPLAGDLEVSLVSSSTNEVVVPSTVVIAAGSKDAAFPVTNLDNGLLEGPQAAAIIATASGFAAGQDLITNYDRPPAAVLLSLPGSLSETSGWVLKGRVSADSPVRANVTVSLRSGNPGRLWVPDSVTIPAGQSAAGFGIAPLDNFSVEGDALVTINATVPGWTMGEAQVLILENDSTKLSLSVPGQTAEGGGVLTNAGTVQLNCVLLTNLTVRLTTSPPGKIQLPESVVIPAGLSTVSFDVAATDDAMTAGNQTVLVTASADGSAPASRGVRVIDNDVFAFSFQPLSSAVVAGEPFAVTVSALNTNGTVVPGYSEIVNLRAGGPSGDVLVAPAGIGPFTNGVWKGMVTVTTPGVGSVLTVADAQDHFGSSTVFDVVTGHLLSLPTSDFAYDALRQRLYAGVRGTGATNGQTIVAIDPLTGAATDLVSLGTDPGRLALSGDNQFLYVGLMGTGGVARVNLASGAVDLKFGLASWPGSTPTEMAVPPGDPHALVVWSSYDLGMALFRDGVRSLSMVSPENHGTDPWQLVFHDSPTNFFSVSGTGYGLWDINLASDGPHVIRVRPGYDARFVYENGLLFGTSGDVYDPANLRHLGAYPTNGLVAANASADRVYFLSGNTLLAFELISFRLVGQTALPIKANAATKLARCGPGALAVATANQLLLIQSSVFPAREAANLSVSQSTDNAVATVGSNFVFSVTVSNAGPITATNVILADLLPADAVFIAATNGSGTATVTNGLLRCTLPTLLPGESITTAVVVEPMTPGALVNTAWAPGVGLDFGERLSHQTNTVIFGSELPPVTRLWYNAKSLAYDSVRNTLWFTTERFGGALESCLRSINLGKGLPVGVLPLNYPTGKIACSANANYLYASYFVPDDRIGAGNNDVLNYIARANLLNGTIDLNFPVLDAANQHQVAFDMIGMAKYPNDIVLARAGLNADVALYEGAVAIRSTRSGEGPGKLEVNPSISDRLYMLVGDYGQDSFVRLDVGSRPIALLPGEDVIALPDIPDTPSTGNIRFANGWLFSDIGVVADPEAMTNVTRLPAVGLVETDPAAALVFYLIHNATEWTLAAFDTRLLAPAWACVVPGVSGKPGRLTRCGPGILAFRTDDDQLFLLNTRRMPHVLQSDLALGQTSSPGSTVTNLPVTFTTWVTNAGPSPATSVVITNQLPSDAIVLGISALKGAVTKVADTVRCDVGDLQIGEQSWLRVVVTLDHPGGITNLASVGPTTPDATVANNAASAVAEFGTIPVSDLSVVQILPSAPGFAASPLSYTLVVSNAGPSDATNVFLTDSFSAGGGIISVSASQGTTSTNGGAFVSAGLGSLAGGMGATVTVELSSCCSGLFGTTAVVQSENVDPSLSDNESRATLPMLEALEPPLTSQIALPVVEIAYDAARQRILTGLAGGAGSFSNGIAGIDARTGAIDSFVSLGASPSRLAVSDDSRYLYVLLTDSAGIARIDLASNVVDLRFASDRPPGAPGAYGVRDVAVMPGSPETVAALLYGEFGPNAGVAVFDAGIQRPDRIMDSTAYRLLFSGPTNLATTSLGGYRPAIVTPTGVTNGGPLIGGLGGEFAVDQGQAFMNTGDVLDSASGNVLARFPAIGPVAPDLAHGWVYFLTGTGRGYRDWYLALRAFDASTHEERWSVPFDAYIGYGQHLITLGTNGLAFLTDANRVFIVRSPRLANPKADLSITQSASTDPVSAGAAFTQTLLVRNSGPWTASDVVVSNTIPTGMSSVSASSTQGTCVLTNGCLLCFLGAMANGSSASITLDTTFSQKGFITNTATVTQSESDPDLTNNATTAVIKVNSQPSLFVGDALATQGTTPSSFYFYLTLSEPSSAFVSVSYQTADGTAVAGRDYSAASGVMFFTPGSTIRGLAFPAISGNPSNLSERFFFLNLMNTTNATLVREQAVGTIVHQNFYRLSIADAKVENRGADTNASFRLTLWPSSTEPVSVRYETLNGTAIAGNDYGARAGMVAFPPGVTNATIDVPVFGKPPVSGAWDFFVRLSDPRNAALSVNEAVGMIVSDGPVGPPTMLGAELRGTDVAIHVITTTGRFYRMERSDDIGSGVWSTVQDQIPGVGALLTVWDVNAALMPARFYRLVLLP